MLEATDIVDKGFQYWGAYGMVIALLLGALFFIAADRSRILKRMTEKEVKTDETNREVITLMVKVEERMTSMAKVEFGINEIQKGQVMMDSKLDSIKEKLNG